MLCYAANCVLHQGQGIVPYLSWHMHVDTLSTITLSRFVPAIWKLVSLDDFSLSMKSLTLASYKHLWYQINGEWMHKRNYGDILNSRVCHFCRNLASTFSSSTLEYQVLCTYGPNAHRSTIILLYMCTCSLLHQIQWIIVCISFCSRYFNKINVNKWQQLIMNKGPWTKMLCHLLRYYARKSWQWSNWMNLW